MFSWPYATKNDREDHAVTLVGWGTETLKSGVKQPFWIVSGAVPATLDRDTML